MEMAVPRFYKSVASHVRASANWSTPGLEEAEESLAVTVEGIRAEAAPASVVQQGNFNGRQFSIFNNGSMRVRRRAERSGLRISPPFKLLTRPSNRERKSQLPIREEGCHVAWRGA